uniref:Uncharacterized protein n=1 Tax=Glossina austeni TaxID=7395 RepID=A0A1A9VA30_GLOAU
MTEIENSSTTHIWKRKEPRAKPKEAVRPAQCVSEDFCNSERLKLSDSRLISTMSNFVVVVVDVDLLNNTAVAAAAAAADDDDDDDAAFLVAATVEVSHFPDNTAVRGNGSSALLPKGAGMYKYSIHPTELLKIYLQENVEYVSIGARGLAV